MTPQEQAYHSALSQCAELLDNMPDGHPITDTPRFLAAKLEQLQASRSRVEGGHGEQESSTSAPLTAPAPLTDEEILSIFIQGGGSDGILERHARAGLIKFSRELEAIILAKAAPAAPVQTEKSTVIDMMQDLMRFECVLTPEGKAEMYARDNGPYVWFDHVISTIEGAPTLAAPVQADKEQK